LKWPPLWFAGVAFLLSEGVLNGFDADDRVESDVSDNLTPAIEFINKFN
jgi:hypothetical protein